MACFLPAIAANPLAPAIELTRSVPPEALAIAAGAVVGVALFGVMFALLSRRKPRVVLHAAATDVVLIPPYPVAPSAWPPAKCVEQQRPGPYAPSLPPAGVSPAPRAHGAPLGFVPSSALSARAFAKMGYTFAGSDGAADARTEARAIEELEELEEIASSELCALETGAVSAVVAPPESIPCVLESFAALGSAVETGPMSAVTLEPVRSSSSSMLAAAPIGDLDLDDGPTELREPFFDEPPQPRRRSAPPRIRPIPPTPPRSTEVDARTTSGRAPLPPVTTPPASLRQPRTTP